MNLKEFFTSHILRDEEGKKEVRPLLATILIVTATVIPVVLVSRAFDKVRFASTDLALILLFLSIILYYYLLRQGRLIVVSLLFLITAWIAITVMAGTSGGIHDITMIGYFQLILLAAFLTGYRFAIILALLSLASFWTMALAEYKNLFVPLNDPPLLYARDFTIFIVLVLSGIIFVERSFRYSFQRISKELQERKKTEEQLSVKESKLLETNRELIESYGRIMKMNEDLVIEKERAERSDKLKTSFLRNISHEIRTPMNGITGFAGLLTDRNISDDNRNKYVKVIIDRTYHLSSLINDLILISKIESGDIEMNTRYFLGDDLINDIKEMFSESFAEKGLGLILTSELGKTGIKADLEKLSTIQNNLISNAHKFTRSGAVTVKFTRDRSNICVSVADTGIGISREQLPVIFDRFTQAEMGLNNHTDGCGLGLSISKGYIDFLGGTINVESEVDRGSVFSFSVPAVFSENSVDSNAAGIGSTAEKTLKILIAEDDQTNMYFLKEIFKNFNWNLIFAVNGVEAVDLFTANPDIDIILMDLKMPKMSGYDAAKIIKSLKPGLPIIAVTAFALSEDKKQASAEHFADYIVKPFDRKNLISRIEKLALNGIG